MIKEYSYININKKCYSELDGKKVIIWGRSVSGLSLYVKLKSGCSAEIIGFTDSFAMESGKTFMELPVFTVKQLEKMENVNIFISTVNREALVEIFEFIEKHSLEACKFIVNKEVWGPGVYDTKLLREMIDIRKKQICAVREQLADTESKRIFDNLLKYRCTNESALLKMSYEKNHKQYFPNNDIFQVGENEIFIDAGGYDGSTSLEFAEWVQDKYSKIYILEADNTMCKVCREFVNLKQMHDVFVENCAAYSENKILTFNESFETGSSQVSEVGLCQAEGKRIDDILAGDPVTYIKMDIEGAEMDALLGCEQSIERYHPKLAISIYHNADDLWEIPYYIMTKYPFYQLYIRHYTDITTETILYASVDCSK